jgi:hypothetical protein
VSEITLFHDAGRPFEGFEGFSVKEVINEMKKLRQKYKRESV